MEKLPPTSYVRMVDVWLIFGILIPFLEVSILTFKEYNNDEQALINHHGRAIEVGRRASAWEKDKKVLIKEKLVDFARALGNQFINFPI